MHNQVSGARICDSNPESENGHSLVHWPRNLPGEFISGATRNPTGTIGYRIFYTISYKLHHNLTIITRISSTQAIHKRG